MQREKISSLPSKDTGNILSLPAAVRAICGKCRVKVLSGKYRTAKAGKISRGDRDKGIVLACQTFPEQEISVELLESSRLVIGDKIALSKSKDLAELFKFLDGKISPIVNKVSVKLPPPSIEDHISDLERLKRELDIKGMTEMRFSHGFVLSMADSMRSSGWDIDLAHVDGAEAIFITDRRDTSRYGLAVDIGTTTIVVYLIDFSDGRLVDVGMTYNSSDTAWRRCYHKDNLCNRTRRA